YCIRYNLVTGVQTCALPIYLIFCLGRKRQECNSHGSCCPTHFAEGPDRSGKSCFRPALRAIVPVMQQAELLSPLLTAALLALAGLLLRPARYIPLPTTRLPNR